jgi:hypothetical protein
MTGTQAGSGATAEMKTQTYKGVLVDLACGSGSGSASASAGTAGAGQADTSGTASRSQGQPGAAGSTASGSAAGSSSTAGGSMAGSQAGSTGTASRAAGGECPATPNSTQLGLKAENGQVYRFDLVGNQRAVDALKTNKGWNKNMTNNKPVKVKISGVLQGDKLIVSSIN